jgi:hypothetical protein
MTKSELLQAILLQRNAIVPPLSDREIIDFITDIIDDPLPEDAVYLDSFLKEKLKIPTNFRTKKEIREEISKTNDHIDRFVAVRRETGNPVAAMMVAELVKKLLRLRKLLDSFKFDTELTQKAKQKPITDLIEFNRGGVRKCLWHSEKTGSLKYYPKNNKVHCFGACGRSFDSIDVLMRLKNISFKEAVVELSQ